MFDSLIEECVSPRIAQLEAELAELKATCDHRAQARQVIETLASVCGDALTPSLAREALRAKGLLSPAPVMPSLRECLDAEGMTIGEIVKASGCPIEFVRSELRKLEREGVVVTSGAKRGKRYAIVS